MNRLKKNGNEGRKQYRRIKRYWKLLEKDADELDYSKRKYIRLFKKELTDSEIVDEILGYDLELRRYYALYQDLLYSFQSKEPEEFFHTIKEASSWVNEKFKKAFRTFIRYRKQITNSLSVCYSNGILEGLNNKIKKLKQAAYGYRNFYHLKLRVFICYSMLYNKV